MFAHLTNHISNMNANFDEKLQLTKVKDMTMAIDLGITQFLQGELLL